MDSQDEAGGFSQVSKVRRLTVTVDEPFDRLRERFEAAVPPLDAARLERLVRERASWDEVRQAAAENAPHHFMIYWRMDVTALFRLAGGTRQCVEYLMGNHVIAERMYRHDPAAMLSAPLRLAIYDSPGATPSRGSRTSVTIDQPSTRFAGLDDPAITEVGLELDRLLAQLFDFLDLPVVPTPLSSAGPARGPARR